MEHYHGALSWSVIMEHYHGTLSWSSNMEHYHGALSWIISMERYHGAFSWSIVCDLKSSRAKILSSQIPYEPKSHQEVKYALLVDIICDMLYMVGP
jgi:hypothetical protein